jgi:hypothetical protein
VKGKVVRTVTIEAEDGTSLTAHEIMVACSQVPEDLKPTVQIKMNGEIKRLTFKVELIPD